ncbi:MAG TPA: rhodanese-like domain-containing protein [Thermoanaerobaculia bacterium]|nr:rhodanese-like domain-containing protein [Thermoanaerobaculia bacterium]
MPTVRLADDTPVVQFDPQVEVSPFLLFRQLREGRPPRLLDVRAQPEGATLAGAEWIDLATWVPEAGVEAVLFDDDGELAVAAVRRLQAAGHGGIRALFGGLDLWSFALDPEVVGEETYLRPLSPSAPRVTPAIPTL